VTDDRPRPRSPFVARVVTAAAYALLFVPLLTVVVYSFLMPVDAGDGRHWEWTLAWYLRLFESPALGDALLVSLRIAFAVSVLASIVGGLGALALERGNFPGRGALATLTLLPLVLPELVLGLASVIWFSLLRMSLGVHSVILAHVTFAVSYVVVTVRARIRDFDPSLEEAAADLGASPWTIFRRVTLPLMAPGIAAGAMMAFTLSFDDFLISFFTSGVGGDTLPMRLYSMVRFGIDREMYALSSILIGVTVVGLSLVRHAGKRAEH
jgi:spermidine/putrescine transport system permease protein